MPRRRVGEPVVVRLPDELLQRLDALVRAGQEAEGEGAIGQVSRSSVARAALVEGLTVLEKRHKISRRVR